MSKDFKAPGYRIKKELFSNWDVIFIIIVLVIIAVALLIIFSSPPEDETFSSKKITQSSEDKPAEPRFIPESTPIDFSEDKTEQLDEELEDIRQKLKFEEELRDIR